MTSKKGISIVEAVVAMAVVFIVIFSASSIIQTSSIAVTKERNQTMAVNDCASIVECYKLSDSAREFADHLAFAGFEISNAPVSYVLDETNKKATYTYNLTYAHCPFDIKVTVEITLPEILPEYLAVDDEIWQNSKFACEVTQQDGTELFSTTYQRGASV